MRSRIFHLIGLLALVSFPLMAQVKPTERAESTGPLIERRVTDCFTQMEPDPTGRCVQIGNTTIGSVLIESLAWQTDPIPFGLVLSGDPSVRERYSFAPAGFTVRDILDSITTAESHYKWTVEKGVINLTPTEGMPSLMETRLAVYGKVSATAEEVFRALENAPEVRKHAAELGFSGPRGYIFRIGAVDTRRFTFQCRDCSVRDILNELVRRNGDSWMYQETSENGERLYRFGNVTP